MKNFEPKYNVEKLVNLPKPEIISVDPRYGKVKIKIRKRKFDKWKNYMGIVEETEE